MSDERMKILEMLKAGDITTEEASNLLEAVSDTSEETDIIPVNNMSSDYSKKYLRVRVYDSSDNTKVNVNLPIKLVKAGISLASKLDTNLNGASLSDQDFDLIMTAIDNEVDGEILSVEADEGETIVKVYVE